MKTYKNRKNKNNLASLVSASQLTQSDEFDEIVTGKSPFKNQPKVNVEIKLMTSHRVCTCSGHEAAKSSSDYNHDRQCDLAPSESTQVMQSINNRFHKYDIKFKLGKNQEIRDQYYQPGKRTSKAGKRVGMNNNRGSRYEDSSQMAMQSYLGQPCSCNGLACCTLDLNSNVKDCRCVVHAYTNTVLTQNKLLKRYADQESIESENRSQMQALDSGNSLLPQRRILNSRHRTMEKWG